MSVWMCVRVRVRVCVCVCARARVCVWRGRARRSYAAIDGRRCVADLRAYVCVRRLAHTALRFASAGAPTPPRATAYTQRENSLREAMTFCRTLALWHGEYSAYDFRDKIYAGLPKYKYTNRSYKILPPFDENRMSASCKKSSDSPDVQEKKPIARGAGGAALLFGCCGL